MVPHDNPWADISCSYEGEDAVGDFGGDPSLMKCGHTYDVTVKFNNCTPPYPAKVTVSIDWWNGSEYVTSVTDVWNPPTTDTLTLQFSPEKTGLWRCEVIIEDASGHTWNEGECTHITPM